MEYKKYEYPSYNIYTVKTNHFKTVHMEILFRDEVNKEDMLAKTFLVDLMTDCSDKYKNRSSVVKKLEELYQASFYGVSNKFGYVSTASFILNFLNPSYVKDKHYLEEVISFPFEMILNPFIKAKEFDIKNFNIIKNKLHDEILSVNEDLNRVSLKKALKELGDTPSSYGILGTLEELEEITPKKLYLAYQKLINSKCDIFIAGNIDMDEVANLIFKYFKYPVINTKEYNLYVENPVKKIKRIKEKSKFLETSLVNIYSLNNLNNKEKITTFYFYNYLLGGGLNSKLYQLLREKNSLCYGIKSMYLKYDNLLVIATSLNKKDVNKAKKLINMALKEMRNGNFTNQELNNAKESFIFSLNLALDNLGGILNNYVFNVLDDLPFIEERIKLIKDITKEDIINVAKKIKANISFVLESEDKDGNN